MAGKEDLKLLGSPVSPFAIRVRMALNVQGVSYQYIEQDLFNKSELLRRSNPVHRKVPVLIHNGRPICESLIIVQYVDQALGGSTTQPAILPADPYDRAIANFWADYIDRKMLPDWLGIMKAKTSEVRMLKARQSSVKMKLLQDQAFTKCSNGKAFFGGDSIGYLDIVLGSYLFWFKTLHRVFGVEIIDAGNTRLLAAWAARFTETTAAKEVAPEEDRMVAHIKKVYRAATSSALRWLRLISWDGGSRSNWKISFHGIYALASKSVFNRVWIQCIDLILSSPPIDPVRWRMNYGRLGGSNDLK